MHISDDVSGEYILTREIPMELIRYQIPGSQVFASCNTDGKLLLQYIRSRSCEIIHSVFKSEKKTRIRIQENGPFFYFCIPLHQDLFLSINGSGMIHLKESQYNLFYSPQFDLTSVQDSGKEYIDLVLKYNLETLRELESYFPRLERFLKKISVSEPSRMLPEPGWLTKDIQDTIYRILHCQTETPSYPVYLDLLARTLLSQLLQQSLQQQPASEYSNGEIDSIYNAEDIITRNIRYHYSIRYIAQKVGINEQKLKNKFKELFGNGVYEHLRIKRMEQARMLLEESCKSIKEIAGLTGYKSVNSFIKAFKKSFQLTPGEYRKRA